jgi:hypothetical protein
LFRRTSLVLLIVLLLVAALAAQQGCSTPSTTPAPLAAPAQPASPSSGEAADVEGEHEETVPVADADTFAGHSRAAAKTSIADAPVEEFADLAAFILTLPSEYAMRLHVPKITEAATSDRVAEETRNVRVHAYIWAAKKESDNDYHLMLGTKSGAPFVTAEVTGLPTSGPFRARLAKARQDFVALVGSRLPGAEKYERLSPPIAVVVTGSIFYDIDHAPGAVGPKWAKPASAWEIHPVTEISVE